MMDMLHILMPYGDQRSLLLLFLNIMIFLNLLRLHSYFCQRIKGILL